MSKEEKITVREALRNTHNNSKETLAELKSNVEGAKLQADRSFIIALIALIFSGLAAYFSYLDSKTDAKWQTQQIEAINEVIQSNKENRLLTSKNLSEAYSLQEKQLISLNKIITQLSDLENKTHVELTKEN